MNGLFLPSVLASANSPSAFVKALARLLNKLNKWDDANLQHETLSRELARFYRDSGRELARFYKDCGFPPPRDGATE